jgi:transposase
MWIADLLAHGLIRSSFVPPSRIQELRDLTRTRKQIVREMSQHTLRIQKTLEDANLKVASVLSSVVGTSGRAMLGAIIAVRKIPNVLPISPSAPLVESELSSSRRFEDA